MFLCPSKVFCTSGGLLERRARRASTLLSISRETSLISCPLFHGSFAGRSCWDDLLRQSILHISCFLQQPAEHGVLHSKTSIIPCFITINSSLMAFLATALLQGLCLHYKILLAMNIYGWCKITATRLCSPLGQLCDPRFRALGVKNPKLFCLCTNPSHGLAVFSFSQPSQSPLPFPAIQHSQAPWCCSGSFSKRRDHLKCHVGIKSAFKSCLIHLWNPLLSASFVRRKVQALIILKHPAKLGGWGAHSPAQGDEFAIYL